MKFQSKLSIIAISSLLAMATAAFAQQPLDSDQIDISTQLTSHSQFQPPRDHTNGQAHARFGINGIDSLVNFNGHYMTPGINSNGLAQKDWFYNTVGNPPQLGGTTAINAPIVPVIVKLLNSDGSQRYVNGKALIADPTAVVPALLQSPIFTNASFDSSSTPTQITDAIQRAEYNKKAKDDWHTILNPSVKTTRTISLLRGTYRFATYSDGTLAYVLADANTFGNELFPATSTDTTTPVGAAENAGEVTTKDMSTFYFYNVYLYVGNPNNCCILGYHTYDVEPGDASNGNLERRYVLNYSSWISPHIFGGGFADVTAVSHELAETYNDPFVASDGVHDVTPFWLAPNGNCQNNLETGDVIEGLPTAVYPITMPNGYQYHPQNEALLQWFEFASPSDALDGAYSYPNKSTLIGPSAPQNFNCQ